MEYSKDQFNCPVEATLFLIGGKYKPLILWYLIEKPLHYMELQRMIPVLDAMCNWGTNFLDRLDIQPPRCTKKSAGEPR